MGKYDRPVDTQAAAKIAAEIAKAKGARSNS
jgi:hypothetical protein